MRNRILQQFIFVLLCLTLSPLVHGGGKDLKKWSILNSGRKISLKNYCESWRMNVELNNIRSFYVVPSECVWYISKYMTSTQFEVDKERAVEQAFLHLNTLRLAGDGMDAWIFDIDDTLLSMVPYFKEHGFGGEVVDKALVEKWMGEVKAPAVDQVLPLYNQLKMRGVKIFLVTGRAERLRDVTAQNLVKAGFMGWTDLIMRGEGDNGKTNMGYKSEKRLELVKKGYRVLGNVGDQWSDLLGSAAGLRSFKLPNCVYYSA